MSAAADAKAVAVEAKIKPGDKFPDVTLQEGNPPQPVKLGEVLAAAKKAIIFGVPGAFTPGCHKTHLPGFVQDFEKLKAKGVDFIGCVSVNDSFVMAAWGEASGATGKIRMLADANAELTKALGLDKAIPVLGGVRCRRFSAIIESGVLKAIFPEPDNVPMQCSTSVNMMAQLK